MINRKNTIINSILQGEAGDLFMNRYYTNGERSPQYISQEDYESLLFRYIVHDVYNPNDELEFPVALDYLTEEQKADLRVFNVRLDGLYDCKDE